MGGEDDSTWHYARNFRRAGHVLQTFHNAYPEKPGPPSGGTNDSDCEQLEMKQRYIVPMTFWLEDLEDGRMEGGKGWAKT